MSASTVAITASPAVTTNPSLALGSNSNQNVRRRTVIVAEKRTNVELSGDGGIALGSDGRDLSHSMKGEAILERPKDLLQTKKGSTVATYRRKDVPKSPRKPRWKTVLRVLAKNLLLLLVFLGLGQLIWKWFERTGDGTVTPLIGVSDFEHRVLDLEAFLKKTTQMMQVQVQVVDKKIGRIEERSAMFESELKKLEAKSTSLENSLGELRDTGIFSKEDFKKFLDEFKESRSLEGSDRDFSLDDVMAFAREIVQKEMERYAADGLGRVDYALGSGGGRVVKHSEPFDSVWASGWFKVAKGRIVVHRNAKKMLEPSFGEPGQCFALKGSSGFVEIRLKAAIIPEAVTLEHVDKSVAYDRSSAPKDCRVSARFQGHDDDPSVQSEAMFLLTEFVYDLEKGSAQTFNVEPTGAGVVNVVRLDFSSNYGSPSYTCIYRLRVHGYEPDSVAATVATCF